jgi:uncharacterized protein (DUF934 family)
MHAAGWVKSRLRRRFMPVFENGNWIADHWQFLEDDAAFTNAGSVIISLKNLQENWHFWCEFRGDLGVFLPNDSEAEALLDYLPRLAIIVLPLPSFNDGRAYSVARKLREIGYQKDIRATGNVLPDQLHMMREVGFTSFVFSERFSLDNIARILQRAPLNRRSQRLNRQ